MHTELELLYRCFSFTSKQHILPIHPNLHPLERVWITWWSATDARVIFLFWISCHLSSEEGLWLQQVTLSECFQTWRCPAFCSSPLLRDSGSVRAPPSLSEEQDCSSTQWNLWKDDMRGASHHWLLCLLFITFLSFYSMYLFQQNTAINCRRLSAELQPSVDQCKIRLWSVISG